MKGKNFATEEERRLTRSISQDSITGDGQKAFAFGERIAKHYNDRRPFQPRSMRSLETKWGNIRHDVSKYTAILQQITSLNPSGTSAEDLQREALELYRLKSPKNAEFTYLHVWELVKDIPRWNSGSFQDKVSAPIMKRKHASSDSDSNFLEPTSSTDDAGGSTSASGRPRPQGSKRAKEERRLTTAADSAAWAQATAIKAMADAIFKKAQVMEDRNVLMLMMYAPDGVLSDTAARYLKLRQEEELEKLEARLAEGRARKTNVGNCNPRGDPGSFATQSGRITWKGTK